MRYRANGNETPFHQDTSFEVKEIGDKLIVRTPTGTKTALVAKHRGKTLISLDGRVFEIERGIAEGETAIKAASGSCVAPMPGQIVSVIASEGDQVLQGDRLLVLEAMKMQLPITAPFDGVVEKLSAKQGDQVAEGQEIAVVKAPDTE